MTWLDYTVIAVLGLSIAWGALRGLVHEVLSLTGWIMAFLAGNLFAAPLAGTDTFHYTVSDGHGGTATAAVTVTVQPSQTAERPTHQHRPHENAWIIDAAEEREARALTQHGELVAVRAPEKKEGRQERHANRD